MTKPLVSIVIPAYNHELYIEECLDSVLEQNYINYELIIIDDGSSDKTNSLINSWLIKNKDELPHCIYKTRENKGVTETLNELISLSSGKYIFGLASDDKVTISGISDLVDYFIQHCDDDSVLYSGLYFIDEGSDYLKSDNERIRNYVGLIRQSKVSLLILMFCNWGAPFNLPFFTKSGFCKICGSYPSQYSIEDYYLALRYFIFGNIRITANRTREYRIHKNDAEKAKNRKYREVVGSITSDSIKFSSGWKKIVLYLTTGIYSKTLFIRVTSKVIKSVILYLVIYCYRVFKIHNDN